MLPRLTNAGRTKFYKLAESFHERREWNRCPLARPENRKRRMLFGLIKIYCFHVSHVRCDGGEVIVTTQNLQSKIGDYAKFKANLIALGKAYDRRNFALAQDLGISSAHLSKLLSDEREERPSPTLVLLVEKLHKEIFSGSTKENVAVTLKNENAKELLEEFTSRLGVQPVEFIEQMLIRYGQKTFDDLSEKQKRQSTPANLEPRVLRAIAGSQAAAIEAARLDRESKPKRKAVSPSDNKPAPDSGAAKE